MLTIRHRLILALVLLGCASLCPAAAPPFVRYDGDGSLLPSGAVARLGTLRLFHPGPVGFKAFTPDGRFLVTATCEPFLDLGSGCGLFHVWDLRTGLCVRRFGNEHEKIQHAIQSPDGRRIVSAGPAGTFLWDIASGRLIRQVEKKREPDQFDRSAFRDAKTLIVVRDKCSETVDLASGRHIRGIRLFEDNVFPRDEVMVLSPDGRRIVTSGDRGVKVVDTATGKLLAQIRTGNEWNIGFHPSGQVFAVIEADKETIQIHDAKTLRMIRCWNLRKGGLYISLDDESPCAFVPGSNLLATGGPKRVIDLWDWSNGKLVRTLGESMSWPGELAFSLDGKLAASGKDLHRIRLFAVDTGKELLPLEGHQTPIQSIRFMNNNHISSVAWDDRALTWDVRTGRVVRSISGWELGDVLSPDSKVRARPDLNGTVALLDSKTGKKRRLLGVARPLPKPGPNDWPLPRFPPAAMFSSDGSLLAYADPFGPVRIWQVDTGKELVRLGKWNNRKRVKCLSFSSDGKRLAAGGIEGDGMVEVWDLSQGKLLRQMTLPLPRWKYPGNLIGPMGGVDAVAFTPNGKAVAVQNSNGSVRLWEIESGRQLLHSTVKPGDSTTCTAIACSPDGRFVASAESGGIIVLWDVASGRDVGRFNATGGGDVQALAFSPDSRLLASGGDNPTILLWKVPDSVPKTRP